MDYTAIGNKELEGNPEVHGGDLITCPNCGKPHPLKGGEEINNDGTKEPSETILAYLCGDKCFLGAVNNKLMGGLKLWQN